MDKRIGKYITKKSNGESFKAYIPPELPLKPNINLISISRSFERAMLALSDLNSISKIIPNTSLFIYMYIRKEALLSSQIEGTQSSFSDLILFEHNQKIKISLDDVEEVSNYIKAIGHALDRLRDGFPLSLRLIKDTHSILLSGTRGFTKLPGEFRRSQNWIGGTRPGNALFVPPSVEHLNECLSNFENFLHENGLPSLIKAGIAHVQFETIHPFLDGNGRLGRLLITLILCVDGILEEPILYLSLYLKQKRNQYYQLLQEVRTNGRWEIWLEFFLDGVYESAKQGIKTAREINQLFDQDMEKISTLGRGRFSCQQILEYMKLLPQVTAPLIANQLKMSTPTARISLNHMISLGILQEITNKKRDKVYVYRKYLDILEEGAKPL